MHKTSLIILLKKLVYYWNKTPTVYEKKKEEKWTKTDLDQNCHSDCTIFGSLPNMPLLVEFQGTSYMDHIFEK